MSEEINPPTLSEMEVSLTHYGVKGMKWGVRKDQVKSFAKASKPIVIGSIAPVATIMGLGPPASTALGLGIFAIQQSPLSQGIKKGATFVSDVTKQTGSVTLSTMQKVPSTLKRNN